VTRQLQDPDLALVSACRDPNDDAFETAFESLYSKYRDRVYAIAYRVTGNTGDALDAVQESFSLVFRKIAGFRADSLFSTWLFRLVVNCSIDLVRGQRLRRSVLSLDAEALDPPSDGGDPSASATVGEVGRLIQRALRQLSPKLRAVLALRYLEGMSYEELCSALEVSMGTVKSRLARAHVALERVLRDQPALRGLLGEEEVA
jgi:RNA polymerase sigma-70 factor (ECF subfamily)